MISGGDSVTGVTQPKAPVLTVAKAEKPEQHDGWDRGIGIGWSAVGVGLAAASSYYLATQSASSARGTIANSLIGVAGLGLAATYISGSYERMAYPTHSEKLYRQLNRVARFTAGSSFILAGAGALTMPRGEGDSDTASGFQIGGGIVLAAVGTALIATDSGVKSWLKNVFAASNGETAMVGYGSAF